MRPKITDLANIEDIMNLRLRPALRAGSAHLMTPAELDEAIAEARFRYTENPRGPNRLESLNRFLAEAEQRHHDTPGDRANRLRERIAWEVTQERREMKANQRRSSDDGPDHY